MAIYKNVTFHISVGILFVLFVVAMGVVMHIIKLAMGFILGGIVLVVAVIMYFVAKKIPLHDENVRYGELEKRKAKEKK